jgi:hypothetical protein
METPSVKQSRGNGWFSGERNSCSHNLVGNDEGPKWFSVSRCQDNLQFSRWQSDQLAAWVFPSLSAMLWSEMNKRDLRLLFERRRREMLRFEKETKPRKCDRDREGWFRETWRSLRILNPDFVNRVTWSPWHSWESYRRAWNTFEKLRIISSRRDGEAGSKIRSTMWKSVRVAEVRRIRKW